MRNFGKFLRNTLGENDKIFEKCQNIEEYLFFQFTIKAK